MIEKEYVTWRQVEYYVRKLFERLYGSGRISDCPGIYTFPRGGWVIAVMLSHLTGLPILSNPVDNCIIVDDILDSGITLKKYSDLKDKHNYFISTMFIDKNQLEEKAEYNCDIDYYEQIKDTKWIQFPWELD